jgi:hypothetical protein
MLTFASNQLFGVIPTLHRSYWVDLRAFKKLDDGWVKKQVTTTTTKASLILMTSMVSTFSSPEDLEGAPLLRALL